MTWILTLNTAVLILLATGLTARSLHWISLRTEMLLLTTATLAELALAAVRGDIEWLTALAAAAGVLLTCEVRRDGGEHR